MAPTYSRDNLAALPTDDDDLTTAFASPADYNAVASNDGTTVDQSGTEGYAVFNFKETAIGNSGTFTWKGQSTLAPSVSVVKLQIYKRTGTGAPVWEDISGASDNSTAADTNFTITGTVPDLTNYKADITDLVVVRAWQAASAGGEITGLTTMASWSEIWSAATQAGSSVAYASVSTVTRNFRELIKNASVSTSGTTIRLKLKQFDPAFTDVVTFSSCYIGPTTGDSDYSSAPTQVFKGGVGNFTLGYGAGYEYTDALVFTINNAAGFGYTVALHVNNQAFHVGYYAGSGTNAYYKTGADEGSTVTTTGYGDDTDISFLASVEKDTSGYPFVYSAALTTEPTTVTENGNPLTNRGTIDLTNSNAGSWHWESDTIYIRPTTGSLDPPYMWS